MSSLQGSALNASRAALAAALEDNKLNPDNDAQSNDIDQPDIDKDIDNDNDNDNDNEPQEVNMETQAEEIRTVFNDPQRFNVKARSFLSRICPTSPDLTF